MKAKDFDDAAWYISKGKKLLMEIPLTGERSVKQHGIEAMLDPLLERIEALRDEVFDDTKTGSTADSSSS